MIQYISESFATGAHEMPSVLTKLHILALWQDCESDATGHHGLKFWPEKFYDMLMPSIPQ